VKKLHPALIILDLMLPDMDGKDICRALKANPLTRKIPILMLTAKTEELDRIVGFELGAEDYLSKPFNPVLLRARVKTSVERKRLRDQDAMRMRQLKRQHEALASEQAKTEQLLLNILPRKIAQRLKAGEEHIADAFPNVSVLFADMVGFTAMSRTMTASALVEVLGDLFSRFDLITEKHGLEKIKTIGDCYMLAGGVPEPMDEHAHAVIDAAIEFCTALEDMRERTGGALRMRIGVHSGPIVAGVIGLRKFTYDLWGDTVNVASRMESTGQPGKIHVSSATADL
jgi:class 3 adenylate cyclase